MLTVSLGLALLFVWALWPWREPAPMARRAVLVALAFPLVGLGLFFRLGGFR